MNQLKDKFRLIYLPFLLIAIATILSCTLLHWLYTLRNENSLLPEDVLIFWLPFVLPSIPVFIWLRPRIRLLHFKYNAGSMFYQLMAILAIAAPTTYAQKYLAIATGKLSTLQTISAYNQEKLTRYYTVENYFLDKVNASVENTTTVTGRFNGTLNLYTYVVIPVLDKVSDTAKGECSFFLGKIYKKSISNSLADDEVNKIFSAFIQENLYSFGATDFHNSTYLERIGYTDDQDLFNEALKRSKYVRYNDPVFFIPHTDAFENRDRGNLQAIFIAFGIGALIWLCLLLFVKID